MAGKKVAVKEVPRIPLSETVMYEVTVELRKFTESSNADGVERHEDSREHVLASLALPAAKVAEDELYAFNAARSVLSEIRASFKNPALVEAVLVSHHKSDYQFHFAAK